MNIDVPKLAAHARRDSAVADLLGDRECLDKYRSSLLVASADRVHQRCAQSGESTCQKRAVTARARLRARHPQTLDPRLRSTRRKCREPRIELPASYRSVTDRRSAAVRDGGLRGAPDTRIRRTPQLAAKEDLALRRMVTSRAKLSPSRQATHEQLMDALIERAQRKAASSQRSAVERPPSGQSSERPIPQHALASPGQTPTLNEQPRVEGLVGTSLDPLKQLTPRKLRVCRTRKKVEHIDLDARRRPKLQRITLEQPRNTQRPAQLGQRPAQRSQRVIRVGEQQSRQTRTWHSPLSQHQIRQHTPSLAPPRRSLRDTVTNDLRMANQTNNNPRHNIDRRQNAPPSTIAPNTAQDTRPRHARHEGSGLGAAFA